MEQLNENQPYYDASAELISSGESVEANTATGNLACDDNEDASEFTKFRTIFLKSLRFSLYILF